MRQTRRGFSASIREVIRRRAALQICPEKLGELWTCASFHGVVMAHDMFSLAKRTDAADYRLAYLMRYARMTYGQIKRSDLRELERIKTAISKLIQAENGKAVDEMGSNHEAAD